MEFDKSRIFTALNADELKIGSKVIVSDSLSKLKEDVYSNANICTLKNIEDESRAYRFETSSGSWFLAYLIEEPNETYYVGYDFQDDRLMWNNTRAVFKHVYYECNTLKEVGDWIISHRKFEPIMRAYELGKQIQYYEYDEEEWCDIYEPKWDIFYEYRIKPDKELNEWEGENMNDNFKKKLTSLLNRYEWDSTCETADYILADYVEICLKNLCSTMGMNKAWCNNNKRLENIE